MSYTQEAENFLKKWGMITHRRIMTRTGCNCPYSVLASLRKRFEFDVKPKKTTNGKPYNLYILKGYKQTEQTA